MNPIRAVGTVERSWSRLCQDLWSLTFEASHVIALRAFAIAAGGPHANAEIDRMIEEKLKALWALQSLFVTGGLGFSAPGHRDEIGGTLPQGRAGQPKTIAVQSIARSNQDRMTLSPGSSAAAAAA